LTDGSAPSKVTTTSIAVLSSFQYPATLFVIGVTDAIRLSASGLVLSIVKSSLSSGAARALPARSNTVVPIVIPKVPSPATVAIDTVYSPRARLSVTDEGAALVTPGVILSTDTSSPTTKSTCSLKSTSNETASSFV